MKTILQANSTILKILRKPRTSSEGYKMSNFCIPVQCQDGVLLFNTLTRELLLLSEAEYKNPLDLEYLRANWFIVPKGIDEREYVKLVRMVMTSMEKKKDVTKYTILTTMDCNARCFYCYELGRTRTPMSEETARKIPEYIAGQCNGKPVTITWFGGEPLYNAGVIDIICKGLQEKGIAYKSAMVSNAYLLDEAMTDKAKNLWNLFRVQITLDGTEEIYNRSKAFIYKEGSAYQIVMKNIETVLDADIQVNIRLNMDLKNADNLLELVDELAARFGNREKLRVYARLIFDEKLPMYERYSSETIDKLYEALSRLNERITSHGLHYRDQDRLSKKLKTKHCMADSGDSVVISPSGNVTLCEHHTDDEVVSHIDTAYSWDKAVADTWRDLVPEVPECENCPLYPECIKLKKCSNQELCYEQLRLSKLQRIKTAILAEYERSKTAENA